MKLTTKMYVTFERSHRMIWINWTKGGSRKQQGCVQGKTPVIDLVLEPDCPHDITHKRRGPDIVGQPTFVTLCCIIG